MKKNIILELDSFYLDRIIEWLKATNFDKSYNIFVLIKQYNFQEYKEKLAQFTSLKCYTYEDLFSYTPQGKLDLTTYFNFNKQFFNNHLTARFLDRAGYFPKYGIGNQNAFCYFTFSAYNLMMFLKEKKIEFICFRNTPHSIEEWLLVQAVEFLDIDFYSLEDYIFPWLFTIKKGCLKDTELVFKDLEMNNEEELRAHITKCLKIVSGDYESAMPTYEKNRLSKGVLKYYNPFNKLIDTFKRPHQFFTKTKNFFYYKKNSKSFDLENTKYIVYFLHFQPERSTLPEGYEFVDQFYTINILSKMLPKGVQLLVKEHPSMFTRISEPKFRNIENYKLINALDNISFVSMDTDSFSLIDHSIAVATIKGTVTLETYLRKKPVIIFGKTNLNLPGVHNFKSIDKLQEYINDAIANKVKIENQIENLTASCLKASASGLTETPENTADYSFKRDVRENASYKLLTKLLEHKLN